VERSAETTRDDHETVSTSSGTDGSNPASSIGESANHRSLNIGRGSALTRREGPISYDYRDRERATRQRGWGRHGRRVQQACLSLSWGRGLKNFRRPRPQPHQKGLASENCGPEAGQISTDFRGLLRFRGYAEIFFCQGLMIFKNRPTRTLPAEIGWRVRHLF
jgi:hypothetical protein